MWDLIKKAGAVLFSPKQAAQQAVREVINQPVQEAAAAAATTAAKKAAEHAQPMVNQMVNMAIDAAKTRVIKEGQELANAGAARVNAVLQAHAEVTRAQAQRANTQVQHGLVGNIISRFILPLKTFADALAPSLKQKSSQAAASVTSKVISAANTTGSYAQSFINGLVSTVVNYISKSFSFALNSLAKAFLGIFISMDDVKPQTSEKKTSESKAHMTHTKKHSMRGPKPSKQRSPIIRLKDLKEAEARLRAQAEVSNYSVENSVTRRASASA